VTKCAAQWLAYQSDSCHVTYCCSYRQQQLLHVHLAVAVICVVVTLCANACRAGLTGLKTLWLGSGDHRLGLSTEQLQELGGQWPVLDSLRLSGFSPLQGFAGLGAFTGLTALSLKPGVGTGGCYFGVQLLCTLIDEAVL